MGHFVVLTSNPYHINIFLSSFFLSSKIQRSIFYVEAQNSQKDILQLQQLETKLHEQSPANDTETATTNGSLNFADLQTVDKTNNHLSMATSMESLASNTTDENL